MWHVLTPNCAFELPMFCRNVDLFPFRRISGKLSRSTYVLFLGKVMPNFCMTLMHAHIFIINLFIITVQTFMMVSGTMVARWLRSAVQDMKENNLTEVLCP